MERLGTKIYENSWEYKVFVVIMRDKNSQRIKVVIYIVTPDGRMSDMITIPRMKIFTNKKAFDFLYDLEGDFGRDDVEKIKYAIVAMLKDFGKKEIIQEKATIEEIHEAVSEYIRINAEELQDNPGADVFINGGYGFMATPVMDDFIKSYKDLGYNRQEVLKRLKIMGALAYGKNRPYDTTVSIGGEKRHVYKILLAKEKEEEKEDEVIEIGD